VLLVGNHALDIVDPLLLLATVFRKLHRAPCFIGHENGWFRVPVLRDISARFNVIPSRQPEQAVAALRRDGFLMLYPGSVREAGMRSYRDEPYRLKWDGRSGFLRVALDAEADVVFVAALGSDEAYYQSALPMPGALTRLVNAGDGERYRGMRLALGLLGPHLVPGLFPPVRLTHVIAKPLDLDRGGARSAGAGERCTPACGAIASNSSIVCRRSERHSDALISIRGTGALQRSGYDLRVALDELRGGRRPRAESAQPADRLHAARISRSR
jgi:hypothetical protein